MILNQDWTWLLRTDPGLPAGTLDPTWPAHRSTATFHRLCDILKPAADRQFETLEHPAGVLE